MAAENSQAAEAASEKDLEKISIESPGPEEALREQRFGQVLLHHRGAIFDKIARSEDLNVLIVYYLKYAIIFSALYGWTLGLYAKNLQIVLSAIKSPILILGTMGICLPALYTFNVLMGSKLSFKQMLAMLSAAAYVMATVLAAFFPIMGFFAISSGKPFTLLLNVVFFGTAGIFGLTMLWSGMSYLSLQAGFQPNRWIIRIWTLIYMFVGTQGAWMLRPFIGKPGEVALFRPVEGNFYQSVVRTIISFLGG